MMPRWEQITFALFLAFSLAVLGVVRANVTPQGATNTRHVILELPTNLSPDRLAPAGGAKRARARSAAASLRTFAKDRQNTLLQSLEERAARGRVSAVRPLWIVNAIALTASDEEIQALQAAFPNIRVVEDAPIELPVSALAEPAASGGTPDAWSLDRIRARELWDLGYRGQGVVVGMMDSGVDPHHPDLAISAYRGDDAWCDVSNDTATCADDSHPNDIGGVSGHGTGVAGILMGGDTTGMPVGAAPDVQWVAVRIFDAQGNSTLSRALAGLEWLLSLDQPPAVVNMSWEVAQVDAGNECNPEYLALLKQAIINLRGAGVLPVAASGNDGKPHLPAAYPEVFAVGSINKQGYLSDFSGVGPTTCAGRDLSFALPYPNAVAPGEFIVTTDFSDGGFPFYQTAQGTSIAAPHASAAAALLLSAYPELDPDSLSQALGDAATAGGDQTDIDDRYGYGVIDVRAALDELLILSPAHRPARPPAAWVSFAGGDATVSWTAAPDPPGSGLTYTVLRDGVERATGLTGTTYTDVSPPNQGAHTYAVVAVDAGDPARVSDAARARLGNVNRRSGPTRNRVDGADLVSLNEALGTNIGSPDWNPAYDLNGDSLVDGRDLDLLLGQMGMVEAQ